MSETTELTSQAEVVLDEAYEQFKQAQLQRTAAEVFADAEKIFAVREMTIAPRQYLFDEAIAEKVIALDSQVLNHMYDQATQTQFLKINFTGNDIRWLLGLPRAHRRHR